ncbi:adenosylcobinamide amidohydrolase [Ancylomarina longa]|uniref:Adenosylcobinamide amidohydrolase n=1 Tax=Ancylomarina longa TaxID=2487017 RepID=A0A434AVN4_9BACT|nr:adenosylcobinamide amidohydrolase [Ancylomarina longa]RUT78541.1 hypothetical protein DLK05_08205 [Ancylomarina longa]
MEYTLEHTDQFFHVGFNKPVRILSSAILNGGSQIANHFFNFKVDENFNGEKKVFEAPDKTLANFADSKEWNGKCVGMMTAALMSSFQRIRIEEQGVWIEVLLTSGVSNARRAGDLADYRLMYEEAQKVGTINILVLTSAHLTEAGMVECIMMVSEAKAACLQDLDITSRISNKIATGTGTDSTAIVSGSGPKINYCGKHVLFGEILAKAVYLSLSKSLSSES